MGEAVGVAVTSGTIIGFMMTGGFGVIGGAGLGVIGGAGFGVIGGAGFGTIGGAGFGVIGGAGFGVTGGAGFGVMGGAGFGVTSGAGLTRTGEEVLRVVCAKVCEAKWIQSDAAIQKPSNSGQPILPFINSFLF